MSQHFLTSPRRTQPWLKLAMTMVVSMVTACGAPSLSPVAFSGLPDLEAAGSASPITVNFNETYGESIAINEPLARRSAHNTDKALFQLIRGAKTSLDGSFYDIEDLDVAAALIEAKNNGVKIRLVTDTDNLVEKTDPSKPRQAVVNLKKAGIPVVDDKRSAIMHDKFLIIDNKIVWTGSTNLTPTSLYRHNNNAMTIRSAEIAKAFGVEFERLFIKKGFGIADRGRIPPLPPFSLGSAEVRVFFSPGGGGRDAVVAELQKATKSIQFLTFSLTDETIGKTILAKAKTGIKVEGVFDRWLAAGDASLFETFKKAKLGVLKDGNEALMHHKVIVIDGATVISGSYNYSENAENNNNEAFLIVKRAPALANDFVGEFKRIQHAAMVNHPPPFKPHDVEQLPVDKI